MIPVLNDVMNDRMFLGDVEVKYFVSFSLLVWNRLSTYEYIVRQRHRQEARDSRKPPPENDSGVPKMNLIKVQHKHVLQQLKWLIAI